MADQLSVLLSITEARGGPEQELRHYIPREDFMTSTLYQEILAEGMAQGMAQGAARIMKRTVLGILTSYLGEVEPRVREQVQALAPGDTLKQWYEEALEAVDATSARRLARKIAQSP